MKKLTMLSILLISLAFIAPMQVSAIPIPPEPGPTSLSCEPSPLEIYHGDSAYFTITITDNDSDDQIKIQNPKVRVSNTGEIKNKSRFSAKERESYNPESGDRTFEVSFTGGPVHDLNGTTEDTVTFEAIYQEASTKEGSLFVRDIKQSVSCLLVVTHSKKPTLTPSGGGIHPPEKSEDINRQLLGSAGVKPGSFFYFFDTAFENIGLFFTFNPEKKAQKALEHADERLAEAEESANENNPKAVEKAMAGYKEEISLATEKSKGLKDEKRAEELLNIVSENITKHQEVLSSVLEKVPEEAKQAILNAIEISKRGQEEAAKQIAELKGEIDQLKKEVADLKKESNDSQANEVEKLKKEVEELKKKQSTVQSVLKQPAPTTQNPQEQKKIEEKPKTTTTTLPNGAIVETDANGNIVRTIKEALQQTYIVPPQTPTQTTEPQNTPPATQTTPTPPPTDLCPNISGVQTTIPTEKILQNGDCITPVPTTSLLLPKRLNYGGQASWPNGNNYGNVNDSCNNCVVLITEMPTTANVYLMEYTTLRGGVALDGFAANNPQSISIYVDNNLSTTHVFLFSHMGIDQTKKYSFIVDATDQNGNKYVQQFGGVDSNSNYLPGPFKWGENQTISWVSDYPSQYMKNNYYVDVPLTKVQ